MPKNNSKARRADRREAAEQRQAAWDALTVDQKIAKLESRGVPRTNAGEMQKLLKLQAAAK